MSSLRGSVRNRFSCDVQLKDDSRLSYVSKREGCCGGQMVSHLSNELHVGKHKKKFKSQSFSGRNSLKKLEICNFFLFQSCCNFPLGVNPISCTFLSMSCLLVWWLQFRARGKI